jgi:hypothetical protein
MRGAHWGRSKIVATLDNKNRNVSYVQKVEHMEDEPIARTVRDIFEQ